MRRLTDDQGDPKEAAAVAQKFASDGSILAVLLRMRDRVQSPNGLTGHLGETMMVTCERPASPDSRPT